MGDPVELGTLWPGALFTWPYAGGEPWIVTEGARAGVVLAHPWAAWRERTEALRDTLHVHRLTRAEALDWYRQHSADMSPE